MSQFLRRTPRGHPTGHPTGHQRATAAHDGRTNGRRDGGTADGETFVLISLQQRRGHFTRPPTQLRLARSRARTKRNDFPVGVTPLLPPPPSPSPPQPPMLLITGHPAPPANLFCTRLCKRTPPYPHPRRAAACPEEQEEPHCKSSWNGNAHAPRYDTCSASPMQRGRRQRFDMESYDQRLKVHLYAEGPAQRVLIMRLIRFLPLKHQSSCSRSRQAGLF